MEPDAVTEAAPNSKKLLTGMVGSASVKFVLDAVDDADWTTALNRLVATPAALVFDVLYGLNMAAPDPLPTALFCTRMTVSGILGA